MTQSETTAGKKDHQGQQDRPAQPWQRHHKLIDLTISKYCDLVRSKIEVEVMKSNPTIDDFPLYLSRMMERWNEKNKKLMIFF